MNLQQRFLSNMGKNGHVGVLKKVYQMIPCLSLNYFKCFSLIHLQFNWLGIHLVFPVLLFQPPWNFIVIEGASYDPVITKLMCHFDL